MGMRENPGSGFIVPVIQLIQNCLPKDKQAEALDILDTGWNAGGLPEFLAEHLPDELPQPEELFELADEDTPGDDMEQGVVYARFDESDLYSRMEKPALKELHRLGINPTEASWSIWG